MRCDSWLALTPPDHPTRKYPPARDEITLPLRGKPLRDRYVLRLIALDRLCTSWSWAGWPPPSCCSPVTGPR